MATKSLRDQLNGGVTPLQPGSGIVAGADGTPIADVESYRRLFSSLGANLDSGQMNQSLLTLLQIIGASGDTDYNDVAKSLFQTLLGKNLTDEQRIYDSPTAQVQRLMAAGMSRDAALAAISGGQQAMAPADMTDPSQTGLNGAQETEARVNAALGPVGAMFSGVQLASGLAQFGLSAPGIRANGQQSVESAYLAKKINEGFSLSASAMGLAEQARSVGLLDKNAEDYQSRADLFDAMRTASSAGSVDDTPEQAAVRQQMRDYFASPDYANFLTNPFAQQNADHSFNSFWSTAGLKQTTDVIKRAIDNDIVDHELKSGTLEQLRQDINNKTAEYNLIVEESTYYQELVKNAYEQRQVMRAQTELIDEQTRTQTEITTSLGFENQVAPVLTQAKINEALYHVQRWALLSDKDVVKGLVEDYIKEADGAAAVAYLECLRATYQADVSKAHPTATLGWDMMMSHSVYGSVVKGLGEAGKFTIGAGALKNYLGARSAQPFMMPATQSYSAPFMPQ